MAAKTGGSSFAEPLHPPCPKSPPKYPDLYGKRREKAKLQMLEREASFLEEELKSVEVLQPASMNCKEVADFVTAKPDPFMPTKNRNSCRFWEWLCELPCCNLACFCCCCNAGCSFYLKCPECCDDHLSAGENGCVAVVPNLVAVETCHSAGTVAVSGFPRAQTASLVVGIVLVLKVQRYAIAAVVQKPVVSHAAKLF
ncbi:hypothetical protein V6N12_067569 [Hibiscus sabdariffa]|uniref:G protein gamma domain-containing protein n=1 Tax=Hibiscus sabdariffa TaxID=183260 RepID=A0ABR2BA03_9ROSI